MNTDTHPPLTARDAALAKAGDRFLTYLGEAHEALRNARRALADLALDNFGELHGDFDPTDYADASAEIERAMRAVRHADRIGGAHCDELARKTGRPTRHCLTIETMSNALVFMEYEPGQEPSVRGCVVVRGSAREEAQERAARLGVAYVEPTDPAVLALIDGREA
ncbi:hypothetical protein ACQP10_38300 (plasmid) [Streptosporangium sandarakinum]|uniref:hypothetical protein n=1 Tax=Streptosporangium sandarakinum TaxID=1260955 RepID=UPI003D906D7A